MYKYFVNRTEGIVFIADIKREILYDPTHSIVRGIPEEDCKRSHDLQNLITSCAIADVTELYLKQQSAKAVTRPQPAPQQQISPESNAFVTANTQKEPEYELYQPFENRAKPIVLQNNNNESIIIDDDTASKVYGASDAEMHIRRTNPKVRKNAETGFLADGHDKPTYRIIEENDKTSYLVDPDSRAEHQAQNTNNPFNRILPPVRARHDAPAYIQADASPRLEQSLPPMPTQNLQRSQAHAHTSGDRSQKMANSVFYRERMANNVSGRGHDHDLVDISEAVDPRMLMNNINQNELIFTDPQDAVSNDSGTFNPLTADLGLMDTEKKS